MRGIIAVSALLWALIIGSCNLAFGQGVNILDLSTSTTACVGGTACGAVSNVAAAIIVPAVNGTGCGIPGCGRKALTITNTSTTATLSIGYNASITAGGAGTIPVPPLGTAFWAAGNAPQVALYGIGSASLNAAVVLGQ